MGGTILSRTLADTNAAVKSERQERQLKESPSSKDRDEIQVCCKGRRSRAQMLGPLLQVLA